MKKLFVILVVMVMVFGILGIIREISATNPLPELATMLLLASGLIGLVGFRRKFRKR